jgi:hypothetical protein
VAIRYATKTGVWSDVSVWDGGTTFPGSGDDVHANNFTVTIDQSITVNSLNINAGGSAVAGGTFTASITGTIALQSLAVGGHTGSSTALLQLTGGAVTLNVASGITGDTSVTGTEPPAVLASGGTHIINGDASAAAGGCVSVTGDTTSVTVNGVITGGTTAGVYGVGVSTAGAQLTITGTVVGGTASGAFGVHMGLGTLRLDALLKWSSIGVAPVSGSGGSVMFKRTGAELAMEAPSDDNWPAATGAAIVVERYTTGNPAPADVREGTLYGPGETSTGTLAVPPPASVAAGVPTDDTVGTAALGLADVLAGTGAQIAAATSG